MDILGVKIGNLTQSEILSRVRNFLADGHQHLIFTPNPEMLVDTQSDWFFKKALNQADLAPADGFGLVLAARYLHHTFLNRFPGVELMEKICEIAAQEGKFVYLVGGERGVAQATADVLFKKYPKLKIVGAEEGINLKFQNPNFKCLPANAVLVLNQVYTSLFDKVARCKSRTGRHRQAGQINSQYLISNIKYLIDVNFEKEESDGLLERIKKANPDILFVAFGHKKQEKWLAEFISELPSVKIGMGVGGSFDYLSGKIGRAPKLLRQLGLEWLWRFLRQPFRRFTRIWKATAIFCFYVILAKWISRLPYRQGVVGFIMNKEGLFFLGRRTPDGRAINSQHWQLPQGGINKGEAAEEAVIREMREETGLETRVICVAQTLHQYDWSLSFFNRKNLLRYRGQRQKIFLLRYDGDDSDIKLDKHELCDFQWVSLVDLRRLLHPQRQGSLEILEKECLTEKRN